MNNSTHAKRASTILIIMVVFLTSCISGGKTTASKNINVYDNLTLAEDVRNTTYIIRKSGVVFDLGNHKLIGNCNTKCVGVSIKANNVTIKNGDISLFRAGIGVNPHIKNTVITNIRIHNNVYHGIYVGAFGSNFTCDRCNISNNGTMGIYLDHSSTKNTITNSNISNNGYRNKDTGSTAENIKNSYKVKREGIAIDSSSYNLVNNTVFKNNALAGITTYKNCGERGIKREHGSNYNTFQYNTFDGNNLWIASRQDRNLNTWDCLSYRTNPELPKNTFVEDHSEYNTIIHNTFRNGAKLVIYDDNNSYDNTTNVDKYSVVRELINDPVM